MTAIVNGEPLELPDGTSVAALLDRLELGGRRVAVEVNREIVGRTAYAERELRDGDAVEVVQFVGGG